MALATYQTRHGPMLAFTGDKYVTPTLAQRGEYAPTEWALLAQLAQPGMWVVEMGANIGVHTVPLARACAPGPIYCFEPQPQVFQALCANLAINGVRNALAYPEACGEAAGWAAIPIVDYDADFNIGGVPVFPVERGGIRVRVTALDDLALPRLDLLKVDVEGFEARVLRGGRETIRRCRPTIYIENDRPEQQGEVIAELAALDYRLYWHTPEIADREVFGGRSFRSINMLGFPAETNRTVAGETPVDPANWRAPAMGPPPEA